MQLCEQRGGDDSRISVRVEIGEQEPIRATATAEELASRFPIVRVVSDRNIDGHRTGEDICVPGSTVTVVAS